MPDLAYRTPATLCAKKKCLCMSKWDTGPCSNSGQTSFNQGSGKFLGATLGIQRAIELGVAFRPASWRLSVGAPIQGSKIFP